MDFKYTLKDKNNKIIKEIVLDSWDIYIDDFVEQAYEDGENGFLDYDIDEVTEWALDNLAQTIEQDGELVI
ncbi:hypothetical protein ACUZ9N_01630 [Mycoplasmopsis gallinarum]